MRSDVFPMRAEDRSSAAAAQIETLDVVAKLEPSCCLKGSLWQR